ncbi:MAG: hypothetical protein EOP92_00625 [Lysobacteraceae bacterium]|nr:MAG: hypothetical protein EOP92_00625 [Xanthomonadaceae bacterium]
MRVEVFPFLLAVVLLALVPSAAAAPDVSARGEIAGLMQALSSSGCQFQRNGSWHDAQEARTHLQRKYDYLLKKGKVDTAEQFIQRAATRSSMSGTAYRVKCTGVEQDSASWFDAQLQRIRNRPAR